MAYTNVDLISDALRELGVISEIETASAEQGAHGLRKLNQMMAERSELADYMGWFRQTSTGDNCPITEDWESYVMCALAARLASNYGATVSTELAAQIVEGESRLLRAQVNSAMPEMDLSNRPRSEGSYSRRGRILTDT